LGKQTSAKYVSVTFPKQSGPQLKIFPWVNPAHQFEQRLASPYTWFVTGRRLIVASQAVFKLVIGYVKNASAFWLDGFCGIYGRLRLWTSEYDQI